MSGTTTPPDPPPTAPEPVWAKPAISVYAMTIFLIAFGIAYLAKDSSSLTMMMGAAITMGSTVVSYWLGSSSGSAKKTDIIGAGPAPIAPIAPVAPVAPVAPIAPIAPIAPVPTPTPTPAPGTGAA